MTVKPIRKPARHAKATRPSPRERLHASAPLAGSRIKGRPWRRTGLREPCMRKSNSTPVGHLIRG